MREIIVSLGKKSDLAAITKVKKLEWPRFVRSLSKRPVESEDKASAGWYCPARFSPAHRSGKNLKERHALTFDYDNISEDDLDGIREAYTDFEYLMYTTASHEKHAPRVRMIFPLSRPATPDEFCCVTRTIGARFDLEKLARESDTPAQMMFLPTVRPGAQYWAEHNKADWVDVDEVLGEYDEWQDRDHWPRRSQGDSVVSADDVEDPDKKPGIVGDFCRAIRVPEAIHRFELPYTESESEGRYTYDFGSRPEGLRLYDEGLKAHSDHDTDPAHGQHNAFDLVRLHRFGHLDDGVEQDTPIVQMPSYKAMCELALEQPEVRKARVENEFEPLPDEDEEKVRRRFPVYPAHEWSVAGKLDWVIKGVIPRAELVVVYGQAGAGKSFFVFDLCASVARGVPWRGHVSKPSNVVYVCAEGAAGFRQRIRAYEQEHDLMLDNFGVIGDAPNILEADDALDIIRSIRDYGPTDLVVIDTLAASMPGGDENTGKDMGQYVKHCKRISKALDATVVLVHHSGKDQSKGARGWSGLKAATDAELEVTRNGDYRTATVTKMKDGADGDSWSFKLTGVTLGYDEDGDEITSCVVEQTEGEPAQHLPQREPGGMYGKHCLRVARKMLKSGNPLMPEDIVDVAVTGLPQPESGARDTRKQNCVRAIQKLVVDGYLFLQNGRVSLSTAALANEEWTDE